jgi:hypothetical protein
MCRRSDSVASLAVDLPGFSAGFCKHCHKFSYRHALCGQLRQAKDGNSILLSNQLWAFSY